MLATRAEPLRLSAVSFAPTSRNWPRKVPAMYGSSKPIVECTESSVQVPVGSSRRASVKSAWFGGPPTVLVVITETREGAAVEVDRVIAREDSPPQSE